MDKSADRSASCRWPEWGIRLIEIAKLRACSRARLSVVPISASNIDLAPIRRTLQSKMRL
jgi:hypothetical protein